MYNGTVETFQSFSTRIWTSSATTERGVSFETKMKLRRDMLRILLFAFVTNKFSSFSPEIIDELHFLVSVIFLSASAYLATSQLTSFSGQPNVLVSKHTRTRFLFPHKSRTWTTRYAFHLASLSSILTYDNTCTNCAPSVTNKFRSFFFQSLTNHFLVLRSKSSLSQLPPRATSRLYALVSTSVFPQTSNMDNKVRRPFGVLILPQHCCFNLHDYLFVR